MATFVGRFTQQRKQQQQQRQQPAGIILAHGETLHHPRTRFLRLSFSSTLCIHTFEEKAREFVCGKRKKKSKKKKKKDGDRVERENGRR